MSDTDTFKLLEVGGLLVGGALVVWWQMRDLKQAKAKSLAERALKAEADGRAAGQLPSQSASQPPSGPAP
jgi:hypothetical protein